MRIDHIRVDAFGKLRNFDTGDTPLGPFVVVLGPNEAGKSTLFGFLTTALFGFQPASRDKNPQVPWGADEAGGLIRLRAGADECAIVERTLRSAPSGTLTQGASTTELRNQPLPSVAHISRGVFRQVFAITLAELAGLDEETWARIQDRVLGSMGASDLRSAREVVEALEKEAGEIWRPNRRGNQRLRSLQEEMRNLRSRRADAVKRDRQMRTLVEEGQNVDLRLHDVRADLRRDKIVVDRVYELLPLKRQLDRVAALREDGGPRAELEGLPAEPQSRAVELEGECRRLSAALQATVEDLTEPEGIIARFDDEAKSILSARDRISELSRRAVSAAADQSQLIETEASLEDARTRLHRAAEQILSTPYQDDLATGIRAVSIDLLRDRVDRFASTDRQGSEPIGAHREASQSGTTRKRARITTLALATVGAGLLAWSLAGGPVFGTIVGAGCLAAGITLGLLGRRDEIHSDATPPSQLETSASERLKGDIVNMLQNVPVRAAYVDPPSRSLVSGLSGLQEVIAELDEKSRAISLLNARLEAFREESQSVADLLRRPPPHDAVGFCAALERELRESERVRDVAEAAERERARLQRTKDATARDLDRANDALEELMLRVGRLGEGATTPPLEVAQRRVAAHARADRIEDELERAHPDLVDLRARIRTIEEGGAAWSIDESDLTDRKVRVEEATNQVEELIARAKTLERDAAHLREMQTVDVVDSELATLLEEETRLTTERDRKWVLAQLVKEADRRFREEHQPDLLRKASRYLSRLTGGRYDRLLVDEGGSDLFQLVGPGLPAPIPLARPVSTGTLEQAYLSLRLAIVDHLDEGKERLPLFIDEAFVNWDDGRREQGFEVLKEVAGTRQVFAFTCHPEMAARLESLGARVLLLDR